MTVNGKWTAVRDLRDAAEQTVLWLEPQGQYSMHSSYSFWDTAPVKVVDRGSWSVAEGRLHLDSEPGGERISYQYHLSPDAQRLTLLLEEGEEWHFQREDLRTVVGNWYRSHQVAPGTEMGAFALDREGGYVQRLIWMAPGGEPSIVTVYGTWRVDGDRLILSTEEDDPSRDVVFRFQLSDDGQALTKYPEGGRDRESLWRRVRED